LHFQLFNIYFLSYKRLFADVKLKLNHIWKSTHKTNVSRTPRLFGNLVEGHSLIQIVTSGKYFAAYYMNRETLRL
jgi:hypothetical protein